MYRRCISLLGVRYAQSTAGKNRFMPPQPLIPWEGVKPALSYAESAGRQIPRMEDEEIRSTKYPWNYEKMCEGTNVMGSGFQSEDCLAVNIWTNGLRDDRKRPVMVWFHGGGILRALPKPIGTTVTILQRSRM